MQTESVVTTVAQDNSHSGAMLENRLRRVIPPIQFNKVDYTKTILYNNRLHMVIHRQMQCFEIDNNHNLLTNAKLQDIFSHTIAV